MIPKIIQLEERFPTGEPTIQIVGQWGRSGWLVEKTALASSASPALEYIRSVRPEPGHTFALVNALGAFEAYDDNRNGDGFPAEPYNVGKRVTCGHRECEALDGWINPSEVLTRHYDTFERYGNIFEHHVNKDVKKSLGTVPKAFWNDRMRRVELLVRFVNSKKPELIERINDGDYPAVSMGCHVRWDVCSVCGHRAPTRKQYCDHLRFEMRKIDPRTGVRYCALNPSCRFFDISIVIRPADTTGYLMKKVASAAYSVRGWELGEKVAQFSIKQALIGKVSDIHKDLVGDVMMAASSPEGTAAKNYRRTVQPSLVPGQPELDDGTFERLAAYSLPEILSTLAAKQAFLTTGELTRLFMAKAGSVARPSQLDKIAAIQPVVLELYRRYPDLYDDVAPAVQIHPSLVNYKLAGEIGHWLQKRSGIGDWLGLRAQNAVGRGMSIGPGAAYEAHAPARSDVLTLTDPTTGEVYRTNRSAVLEADHEDNRNLLGSAALLGGAYTVGLGMTPLTRRLPLNARALAGLVAGYGTAAKLKREFDPLDDIRYDTDQGIRVPGSTEFRKTSEISISCPALLDKMAMDYGDRLAGKLDGNLAQLLASKIASASPGSLLGSSRDTVLSGVLDRLDKLAEPSYDAVEPDVMSFDSVVQLIGRIVS